MPQELMSTRRRMTIATWKPPREGVIHGMITLDATEVLKYLERAREATGEKVTITSFVGAAVGKALALEPTLNGYIAFGKYYHYDDVSVSFLVQVDGGKQLAQVLVKDIDQMSPAEVAAKLQGGASHIRTGKDENFKKSAVSQMLMQRRMLSNTAALPRSLQRLERSCHWGPTRSMADSKPVFKSSTVKTKITDPERREISTQLLPT